jgi:predicted GNAT superfamily acetyltransferase
VEVEVRTVHDLADLDAVRVLCDATWPSPTEGTQVTPNLLRAIDHAGGHVGAAYDQSGELVGGTIALMGRHRDDRTGQWASHLHSHMAAVAPFARDQHVGSALKQHQRDWCLASDVPEIWWTFDPLVRRNARLNLVRLGADITDYLPDFYGSMDDALNAGDRSDRLLVRWRLESQRAEEARAGLLAPLSAAGLRDSGAVDAVYVRRGLPQVADPEPPDEAVLLVPLPPDITALRALDTDLGLRWRLAVRAVLQDALMRGRPVVGVTDEGHYVLGPVE